MQDQAFRGIKISGSTNLIQKATLLCKTLTMLGLLPRDSLRDDA